MAAPSLSYKPPDWALLPPPVFSFEVFKGGVPLETLPLLHEADDDSERSFVLFGRAAGAAAEDGAAEASAHHGEAFALSHPSSSRHHAVVQFGECDGRYVHIFDLGSTHGTWVNKKRVLARTFVPLHVGDIVSFGASARLYCLSGPEEMRPKEGPNQTERAEQRQREAVEERRERERQIEGIRSQRDSADWGMGVEAGSEQKDAFVDSMIEDFDFRTYTGPLSEKQRKQVEKLKRKDEKVRHLKREIELIQAKETKQDGGLTQGQQTQVARNEQRAEVLENEIAESSDVLQESIEESTRQRLGLSKSTSKQQKQRRYEEDEGLESDEDDDFYDRTNAGKAKSTGGGRKRKAAKISNALSIETLWARRELTRKEIDQLEERKNAALLSKDKCTTNNKTDDDASQGDDELDNFFGDVELQAAKEAADAITSKIEILKGEEGRLSNLIAIADPSSLYNPTEIQLDRIVAEECNKGKFTKSESKTVHQAKKIQLNKREDLRLKEEKSPTKQPDHAHQSTENARPQLGPMRPPNLPQTSVDSLEEEPLPKSAAASEDAVGLANSVPNPRIALEQEGLHVLNGRDMSEDETGESGMKYGLTRNASVRTQQSDPTDAEKKALEDVNKLLNASAGN